MKPTTEVTNSAYNKNVGNTLVGIGGRRDMEGVKNKWRDVRKKQSNSISFYKFVKLKMGDVIVNGETNVCLANVGVVCMPCIYIVYPQQFYKI